LNKLIPKNSAWTLQTATGVNDKGQIVGYALTLSPNQTSSTSGPTTPTAAKDAAVHRIAELGAS